MNRCLFAVLALSGATLVASPMLAASAANAPGADPVVIAGEWLGANLDALGLAPSDVAELVVTDDYPSAKSGLRHVWLQQHYLGIPIVNALVGIHVRADGRVLTAGDRLERNVLGRIASSSVVLSPADAIDRTVVHLGLRPLDTSDVLEVERLGGPTVGARFSGGSLSAREIPVDLAWIAAPEGGAIRLAWRVEVDRQRADTRWPVVFVDAVSGAELARFDQVAHSTLADYRVYPAPHESPQAVGATHVLAGDPWDVTASPFGWHDTDGDIDPDFTDTRGNNVFAQDDIDDNNSGGLRPSGGAGFPLLFDFAHDDSLDPASSPNLEAAIVSLFYWNNITHDILYRVGFDEPARNFQENNYGNGGAGSDSVNADALDGSGVNNANFGTPGDGSNPRMQMYRWTDPFGQLVTVNSPVAIAGDYVANPSNNGGTANGLTHDMVLVVDGTAPFDDACEALTNGAAVNGKIALIRWSQGVCNSSQFVANAAAAGAVAAIIIDSTDEPFTNFGGATIPSVAVGQADGNLFVATLAGDTVNATIDDNPGSVDRDSDFDAGVIGHEYGHGWSNRLTGGASVGCLSNAEQAGEGWSDFLGMVLTMPNDGSACSAPRGVGNYASFLPLTGPGIRRYPYTRDMGTNPFTYDDTNDPAQSAPHGVGSVWATALWDMVCNLVDEQGFDTFPQLGLDNGGNTVALQIVSDGLKLQPCSPGMIDARNAILAADEADYNSAHKCLIWETFARRGFGFSATQGLNTSRFDQVEAFDMPAECPDAADVIFRDGFEIGDSSRWSATLP